MPPLVGAGGGPTKVGTYQGDAAVVAGGSAGRWPVTAVGRCRPWSALWAGQPRLAPTRAMRRLLQGVAPAAGRQPVLVDADLGRRCGFVPTKVGTYQGDAAVVAGGSA